MSDLIYKKKTQKYIYVTVYNHNFYNIIVFQLYDKFYKVYYWLYQYLFINYIDHSLNTDLNL